MTPARLVLCGLIAAAGCASAPASGLDHAEAGRLLSELDLSSFRNSTGPRREPSQRTLADLGVAVTQAGGDRAEARSDSWLYALTVLARSDANGDGEPDVSLCFEDRALNSGSYDTRTALLVQRVGGRWVALRFEPTAECPDAL
ncbi:hypothetical protein [Rubrivirga sp.]|uniref:hypothetical protein n=1 Tax=Rubrivirga sp. TaxID=1885344 RepID=UPI003B523C91